MSTFRVLSPEFITKSTTSVTTRSQSHSRSNYCLTSQWSKTNFEMNNSISTNIMNQEEHIAAIMKKLATSSKNNNLFAINLNETAAPTAYSSVTNKAINERSSLIIHKPIPTTLIEEKKQIQCIIDAKKSKFYKISSKHKYQPMSFIISSFIGDYTICLSEKYSQPTESRCDALFTELEFNFTSNSYKFYENFIYIGISTVSGARLVFRIHFADMKNKCCTSTRKLRPLEMLRQTLHLVKVSPSKKQDIIESASIIKKRKQEKLALSNINIVDHVSSNINGISIFTPHKHERMQSLRELESSRYKIAKEKRSEDVRLDTARKLISINRLEIKSSSKGLYHSLKDKRQFDTFRAKQMICAIVLSQYCSAVTNHFKREALLKLKAFIKKISICKIVAFIKIRIRISACRLGFPKHNAIPMMLYLIYSKNSSTRIIKARSSKTITQLMQSSLTAFTIKKMITAFYKRISKVKRVAKKFRFFTVLREQMIETYFQEYIKEYKQIAQRLKQQPFAAKLEEYINKVQAIPAYSYKQKNKAKRIQQAGQRILQ